MTDHASEILLQIHDNGRDYWEVFRKGPLLIKKYAKVGPLFPLTRRWKKEHFALKRLEECGIYAARSEGFHSPEKGCIIHARDFLEGEELTELNADQTLELAKHLADIHNSGVTHGDLSVDNIILMDQGEIHLIDYGRARTFSKHSPLRFYNTGKDLARARKRLFANSDANWHRFYKAYHKYLRFPGWGKVISRYSLAHWLNKWRLPPLPEDEPSTPSLT